jgi:hypothetical protein
VCWRTSSSWASGATHSIAAYAEVGVRLNRTPVLMLECRNEWWQDGLRSRWPLFRPLDRSSPEALGMFKELLEVFGPPPQVALPGAGGRGKKTGTTEFIGSKSSGRGGEGETDPGTPNAPDFNTGRSVKPVVTEALEKAVRELEDPVEHFDAWDRAMANTAERGREARF